MACRCVVNDGDGAIVRHGVSSLRPASGTGFVSPAPSDKPLRGLGPLLSWFLPRAGPSAKAVLAPRELGSLAFGVPDSKRKDETP